MILKQKKADMTWFTLFAVFTLMLLIFLISLYFLNNSDSQREEIQKEQALNRVYQHVFLQYLSQPIDDPLMREFGEAAQKAPIDNNNLRELLDNFVTNVSDSRICYRVQVPLSRYSREHISQRYSGATHTNIYTLNTINRDCTYHRSQGYSNPIRFSVNVFFEDSMHEVRITLQ